MSLYKERKIRMKRLVNDQVGGKKVIFDNLYICFDDSIVINSSMA